MTIRCGHADAQAFQVPYGAGECLVYGDDAAALWGELTALVHRVTGEVGLVGVPGHLERLGAMERVGSGHAAS